MRPRPLCLRTFYLRRFIRIYIPWLFVFLLSVLAAATVNREVATIPPTTDWLRGFWNDALTFRNLLPQFGFLSHDTARLLVPQDWSLGVELKGSALIPLFLFLVRRHVVGLLAATALLLIVIPTGHYYLSFAFGVIAARYHPEIERVLGSLGSNGKVAVFCSGLVLYEARYFASSFGTFSAGTERLVWCIVTVGCVLILTTSLSSKRVQTLLNHPPFVFLGRISYSLFLLQFAVLLCISPYFVRTLNSIGITQVALLLPVTMTFSVLTTDVLALLTYRLIEVPSIEFGRKLTRLIQSDGERLT